jgi:arginyl-tRNA synthetase
MLQVLPEIQMINTQEVLNNELSKFEHIRLKATPANLKKKDYHVNLIPLQKKNILEGYLDFVKNNNVIQNIFVVDVTENDTGVKFQNFTIRNEFLFNMLSQYHAKLIGSKDLNESSNINFIKTDKPKKIIFDYSSPNLAKNMHVGHLRSTIIGDTLANIFEDVGHTVIRHNHIGDFGLPFGMIVEYVISKQIDINTITLQEIYTEAKKQFDSDLDFNSKAYNRTQILQINNDELTCKIWNQIYQKSLSEYQTIYNILNISKKLEVKGESYYLQYIPMVKDILSKENVLDIADGRTIVKLPNAKFMTFIKSDNKGNAYTYETTDITALYYRTQIECADEVFYVVDSGQSNHFKQLFLLGQHLGWSKNKRVEHIQFGIITNDSNKRIKSREGNTPKLLDLVNDAIEESTKVYFSKKKDNIISDGDKISLNELQESQEIDKKTISSLAIGSLKYYDLSMTRTNDYKFQFSQMLQFNGNTYTYVTYTLARCSSVFEKLKHYTCSDGAAAALYQKNYDVRSFILNVDELTECDFEILHKISYFPTVIEKIITTLTPHLLCDQLYELVDLFNNQYKKPNFRCIQYSADNEIVSINKSRIVVYNFVKNIIEKVFDLLNLPQTHHL